ncbi:M15 family metallopeptidase [Sphingomonas sp.]|uniref:M15 family metallopeptidase n=1 Tax=Sphingomonas sp. TaxID=28214 RepID=UPI002ED8FA89
MPEVRAMPHAPIILALLAMVQAPAGDGRVLGHFGYGDIPSEELADAPDGFALGTCRVRREVIADLQRLLDAARSDPATGGTLRGLSCHRSIARQTGVFARGGQGDPGDRAISVAPPGHSEHTTGFAIDFAVRPAGECPDAEACMATTAPARWLIANATRFGFEQSFPAGNKQGVKWEPWHWRWVGASPDAPGAARARFVFAAARARFPAAPKVAEPLVIRVLSQPPVPVTPAPPSTRKIERKR